MAHEKSPLTLLSHKFTAISCEAASVDNPTSSLSLSTEQRIAQSKENPHEWKVELKVSFQASEPEAHSPYTGSITIQGHFKVQEGFNKRHHEALVRVTGSSMLYGACREMLANFTARSTHGMMSLPSISFREKKDSLKKSSDSNE